MRRIVLIDDHPLYRHGFVAALQAKMPEFHFEGVGSVTDGLRHLADFPDTELAIVDFRLPEMDGLEALAQLGARYPSIPRILISGQEDAQLMHRALAGGAAGFIPKSLGVIEIEAALRQVLNGDLFVPRTRQAAPPDGLTLRQLEVLRLLAEGHSNRAIAQALAITERTVKAHLSAVFERFGVGNRAHAVLAARRRGLV